MNAQISSRLRLLRFVALGMGILWLLWLPVEDTSERSVIIFALTICGLLAARVLISPFASKFSLQSNSADQKHSSVIRSYLFYALLGSLAGVGVTLVSLLLMVFKTGLHGHATPDYSLEQMIAVIQLTPIWILGCVLTSLGVAFCQSRHG